MIVSCPACSTRFRVDATVLGASGRKLKCGRCAHQWLEGVPEEPIAAVDPVVEEEPAIPEPDPVPQQEPEIPEVSQADEFRPRSRGRNRPTPKLPVRTRRSKRRRGGLGWGLATAMAALVVAVLALGREQLVSFWPPADDVYATLGFGLVDRPAGDGLELLEIVPSRLEQEGVAYLVLDGTVLNTSDEPVDVPQMVAVVRDAQNVALQQWTFSADVAALQPGQSVSFTTRLADPADTAADVKIVFMDGAVGE